MATNFLAPILQQFLATLPVLTITNHPAFQILVSTHPTYAPAVAATGPTQATTGTTSVSQSYPYRSPANNPTAASAGPAQATGIYSQNGIPRVLPTGTTGPLAGLDSRAANSGAYISPVANTPSPVVNNAASAPAPGNIRPPTPGIPNPTMQQSPNQPLPQPGPNASMPIGNSGAFGGIGRGGLGGGIGGTLPWDANRGNTNQSPVNYIGSNPNNANPSGVLSGPEALNHVPYGPELTGLGGFGGLITPNGTPVAMSAWQKMGLDPTSISRYNSYVSDVAGMNPADLAQIGMDETSNRMSDLKAPIRYLPNTPIPAAGGG